MNANGLVYQPSGWPHNLLRTTLTVVSGAVHSESSPSTGVVYLFDVKQYPGETLKEYINRFGAQVVKVGTIEEPMIVHAFRKGMCPGPFCESIIRSRPRTFAEIRRRTMEHIATEGEVCEKRTSVAPARRRAQSRAQPARVNEATTGKRGQDRRRPYEARKP